MGNKLSDWLIFAVIISFIFAVSWCSSIANAQDTFPTIEGINFSLLDDSDKLEVELPTPYTEFGQVVVPQNYAAKKKELDPAVVELIDRLIATADYKGFVLSHRTLVLVKYRSEDWNQLTQEFAAIYGEVKK